MADYLGYSKAQISRYLNDKGEPPRAQVLRLWAMKCGVPLDWLRYGTETQSNEDDDPGGLEVSGRAWNGQVLAFPTARATDPRSVAA